MFKITYEMDPELRVLGIPEPCKANDDDSGFDVFSPIHVKLKPGERRTVKLGVKFKLKPPCYVRALFALLGLGIEAHVRPKSGRSAAGIDVELGTIDAGYRNYCGATVTNVGDKTCEIRAGEKICQIVLSPVFNGVKMVHGEVSADTQRGLGGFGSSGLGAK